MKLKNGLPKSVAEPPALTAQEHELADPVSLRPSLPLIHNILVAVDFSACSLKALEYAAGLAAQLSARVTVLHVVEPALHADNYLASASSLDLTSESLLQAARERLAAVAPKHLGSRAGSELLVRMGRAPSEVLDTAKALGADLIVIGTHGHAGLNHLLLGSTAERVLAHSPCPLLTIRC